MTKRRPLSPPPDPAHVEDLRKRSRHDAEARAELLSLAQKSRGGRSAVELSDFVLTKPPVTIPAPIPTTAPPPEPAFEVVSVPTKGRAKRKVKTNDRWAGVTEALAAKEPKPTAKAKTQTKRTRKSRRKAPGTPRKPRRYIEDEIQKECAAWLDTTPLADDWLHPPLEQFNKRWAGQMWAKGARSGWPDFLFFRPTTRTKRPGLAIELKRPDKQRVGNPRAGLSKTQIKRLARLESWGWAVAVAYSTEQVKALVFEHYGDPAALAPPPETPEQTP